MKAKVICVHIGARAHYLIPKALEQQGLLHTLITETWVRSKIMRMLLASLPVRMLKSLSGRYASEIPSHKVYSFGFRFLCQEFWIRVNYKNGWSRILARNAAFEKGALTRVRTTADATAVLGICYTSLEVFKQAKSKGLKPILYQMDPGFEEELIVGTGILLGKLETGMYTG
jgi:hypothetical protein